MNNIYNKINKHNQTAYIIQAMLEYFVTLLVTGAFLAAILKNIGVPDAVVGVISTLTSLGISAQLVAVIFIRPKGSVKKMVTWMHFLNQIMFVILYLIPYIKVSQTVKVLVFIIMFLGGHLIMNVATPFKLSWLMSYVPDDERGKFTADKEIVSLLSGIIFSYIMGAIIDYYELVGKAETGFILSGIALLMLSVIHLFTLIGVKEDKNEKLLESNIKEERHTVKSVIEVTLLSKAFRKIIFVDVLWQIATGITMGFFATYQINELSFSLKYVAILTALYSIVRVLFSRYFGKFADKHSWAKMLMLSFGIAAVAYFINIFTVPSNGKIVYAIFYSIYGVYMAGANSGLMNIVFDYVSHEDRSCALGVKSALGGIVGFGASLVGAEIVNMVQSNGNIVFGRTIYAQQILSFIAFVVFVYTIFYIKVYILKMKKYEEKI